MESWRWSEPHTLLLLLLRVSERTAKLHFKHKDLLLCSHSVTHSLARSLSNLLAHSDSLSHRLTYTRTHTYLTFDSKLALVKSQDGKVAGWFICSMVKLREL